MPICVKGIREIYKYMVEILLMLQVFLAEDPEIEYLLCGAPFCPETKTEAFKVTVPSTCFQ